MSQTDQQDIDSRLYWYQGRVLRVVDGDTLDVLVDLGFKTYRKMRLRLYGVDTPEVYGVKKGSEEYEAGKRASSFVDAWVASNGGLVLFRSHDGGEMKTGKYGRYLAEVYGLPDGVPLANIITGQTLNQILVEKGLAEAKTY